MKIKVSVRTVLQRIRRKLGKFDQTIIRSRPGSQSLGEYYILNYNQSEIVGIVKNFEEWSRAEGYLRNHEEIV
jgi:hypothetical protein